MAVLVTKWFAAFVVEAGRVVDQRAFPATVREIAQRLAAIRRGETLPEERALARPGLEVLEGRLRGLGKASTKSSFFDLDVPEPDASLLHGAALLVARDDSREAAGERDRFVAEAVRAMDEVTTSLNTLVERLREWYGLHFPEALSSFPDASALLQQLGADASRAAVAGKAATIDPSDSVGVEFSPGEQEALQGYAAALVTLARERDRLSSTVAAQARQVAPNLARIVGDVLAARLISAAGSLGRLAAFPASTVQTLGAETALFAHLKDGKRPPKHGVLFQHPLVNAAPRNQRGRFARVLATNAAIAARLDYADPTLRKESEALLARVEAAIKRIKAAPARPVRRPLVQRPRPFAGARGGRR